MRAFSTDVTLFRITKMAFLTSLCLVCSIRSVHGSQDPVPPLDARTLAGVWEAAGEGGDRVYRLAIDFDGRSYLAFVLADSGLQFVYALTDSQVTDGKLNLRFRNISAGRSGDDEIEISGRANVHL